MKRNLVLFFDKRNAVLRGGTYRWGGTNGFEATLPSLFTIYAALGPNGTSTAGSGFETLGFRCAYSQ